MNQNNWQQNPWSEEELSMVDIFKEIKYYLFFWPFFLLSLIVAGSGVYTYLSITNPIYQTKAQIQIKKGEGNATSFLTKEMEGLFNLNEVNIENEIAVINSNRLIGQVIDRLNLQFRVEKQEGFRSSLILSEDYPFLIEITEGYVEVPFTFTLEGGSDEVLLVMDSLVQPISTTGLLEKEQFTFHFLEPVQVDVAYTVQYVSQQSAINRLRDNLTISPNQKGSEVLDLTYQSPNAALNERILNTLIQVLNEDQVADKRLVAETSINFIDERLAFLGNTIDSISQKTIDFQTSNQVIDPTLQTGNGLANLVQGEEQVFNLGIQKEVALSLLDNINAQSTFEWLPVNLGLQNQSIYALVERYNELLTQRKNLLVSATEKNPMVIQLNTLLNNIRGAIISGIEQYIADLEVSITRYNELQQKTQSAVSSLPKVEKTLSGFARNFKVTEDLYLFLLERKEEASISYITALPDIKILSEAVTQPIPIAPKRLQIIGIAVLLSLLLPFGILFLLKVTNTKINTKEDLDKGLPNIAVVGEIPLEEDPQKVNNPRGTIAEANRIMRSNLSFLMPQHEPLIILVSSSIKGEGKTFVSYNIAKSYAALGKKVIIIGADLRNPQLHKLLNINRGNKGLSTLLSFQGDSDIASTIIQKSEDPVDYLLSGAIPPNPSELLASPKTKKILDDLKKTYDVIVLDTAPIMLVSDTQSLLPLADVVLYVTRAQYTDKKVFEFIRELKKKENLPVMAIAFNGIISGPQSKYKYDYKYRYSYTYRYNYGYGYGYESDGAK
jgi:tyrosine-protein kinase Etk/Wzc